MLDFFSRVFGEVFLIIGGVENALISKAFFLGCQHGVGERVSLRGADGADDIYFHPMSGSSISQDTGSGESGHDRFQKISDEITTFF